MKKTEPEIKNYVIDTGKLSGRITAIFFSDLHGNEYGSQNCDLISLFKKLEPDIILCGGDLMIGRETPSCKAAIPILKELSRIAPLYLAPGNHESKFHFAGDENKEKKTAWTHFENEMKKSDVHFLDNKSELIRVRQDYLCINGFELPLGYYKKFKRHTLPDGFIENKLGKCDPDVFSILLAHNPVFAKDYDKWGADLTLCGHYHGGLMHFGNRVLVSPYGFPFPKYGYGHYDKDGRNLIVTSGLGEHVLPFRIHNPFEIVRLILR